MLSKTMEAALNAQLNAEFYSAYLYLSMSGYFRYIDMPGFSHWMKVQFDEEMLHAMKFFNFIDKAGGTIKLKAIDVPPTKWESPLAVFEATYEHECMVSGKINELVNIANRENDNVTRNFLQWFVDEQIEEEENTNGIVEKILIAVDQNESLLKLDGKLGKRKEVVSVAD